MSYVKTTWATGDVITAEKLNNMEGGISANDSALSKYVEYKIKMHNSGSAVTVDASSDISSDDIIMETYPSAAAGTQYLKIRADYIATLGKFAGWRCVLDKIGTTTSSPGNLLGGAAVVATDGVDYFRFSTPNINAWEDFTFIIYIIPVEPTPEDDNGK